MERHAWQKLPHWKRSPGLHPDRPDPYLLWATLTHWRAYDPPHHGCATAAPARDATVLLELKGGADSADAFLKAWRQAVAGSEPTQLPGSAVCSARLPRAQLNLLCDPEGLGRHIERFELSQPVIPARVGSAPQQAMRIAAPHKAEKPAKADRVLGVIDDGCIFAHPSFVRRDPAPQTRVLALWDQGAASASGPGAVPYGQEIGQLDEWIQKFAAPDGSLDEDTCYEAAGYHTLRKSVAHGAHVMDVLAGPRPMRSRISLNPDSPPSFKRDGDAASRDIVFVQLPKACIQDPSGSWLGAHVLDAVNYILGWAAHDTPTVISLSYGPTVGPHDGSSLLETALAQAVEHRARPGRLDIAIAAGNSFNTGSHAVLDMAAGEVATLSLRVLPGSEAPSFMQLWWDDPEASGCQVRITPPGTTPANDWLDPDEAAVWPNLNDARATAVFARRSARGDAPMLLLALAATECLDTDSREPIAPHGDWTIEVRAASTPHRVRAYIARNDPDIGGVRRGRQARFVDRLDDPHRHLGAAPDDPGVLPAEAANDLARQGSVLRRRGAVNGIACGGGVTMVTGYRLSDRQRAPYASQAPLGSINAPDYALPTDESMTLPGIRAAGTRGASTFRLVGTSSAPPQYARKLAAGAATPPPVGSAGKAPPQRPLQLDP